MRDYWLRQNLTIHRSTRHFTRDLNLDRRPYLGSHGLLHSTFRAALVI